MKALVLLAFIIGVLAVAALVRESLARENLNLSFGFLLQPIGINISESLFPVNPTDPFVWLILAGLANTVRVSLVAGLFATLIGVVVGIARLSEHPLLKALTGIYIQIIRNTPLLLQLIFWYMLFLRLPTVRDAISFRNSIFLSQRGLQIPDIFWRGSSSVIVVAVVGAVAAFFALSFSRKSRVGRSSLWLRLVSALCVGVAVVCVGGGVGVTMPQKTVFNYRGGMTLTPEFMALMLAQGCYGGAFVAELVRGGLQGVPKGQWEAAQSLGISYFRMLRLVIIPQSLVTITPSLTTQYISIVKNSSLAIAVGFPDLFWALSSAINLTGHAIEGVTLITFLYLLPILLAGSVMSHFNARITARGQR